MATITLAETKVVQEFRAKVKDLNLENAPDTYMLRWLRVRGMNVTAAEEMLRKHVQWRKDEDFEHILDWVPPPTFSEDYKYYISGPDSDGNPILILPFGTWDNRKTLKSNRPGMRAAYLRHYDQIFSKACAKKEGFSTELGREITQFTFIVDYEHLSMGQLASPACVGAYIETLKRFEAHYPDCLSQLYFINANRAFQILFAALKPFFSTGTLGKLEIYGSPDKWIPVLTSRFPGGQLPLKYRELQKTSKGNCAPESMDENEMACLQVAAGETCKHEFSVKKANSTLRWMFRTEANDIAFAVFFGKDELVKSKRYEASQIPTQGSLVCHNTGNYVLHFDNSYSLLKGKTVFYNVEVTEPE